MPGVVINMQAARIRDTMSQKGSDNRLAVEDANKAFYDAFRRDGIAILCLEL